MFLLAFLAFNSGNIINLLMLLMTLAIHELSHLFCCNLFEYRVLEVKFTPFGGSLKIDPLFEINPVAEAFIAAAGPFSNFLMAGGVFYLRLLGVTNNYLDYWQTINLVIGGINLAPAFPLDGGRILHSWLNNTFGFEAAAFFSKVISIIIAFMVLVLGIVKFLGGTGGIVFIVIGGFIFFHIFYFNLHAPHLDFVWQLLQRKKRFLKKMGVLNIKPVMVTPDTLLRVPLQKHGTNDYLLFFVFSDENHFSIIGEELVWKLLINNGFTSTFQETLNNSNLTPNRL